MGPVIHILDMVLRSCEIDLRSHNVLVSHKLLQGLQIRSVLKHVDGEGIAQRVGRELLLDTSSKKLRQAHSRYFMERQEQLRQMFSKSNVDWTSIATDGDYVKSMMQLFEGKR